MTSSSRPPVVVLLGGPSAEHDVSVVSGTAIAEALSETGHDVAQVLIDLDGRWWWLPADHRRADRPAAAYDDPAGLGADGPIAAGAALDRLAGLRPGAGRVHRPPRPVRRGRHRPGPARGGRPGLHRLRRGGVGAGHGQGAVQADEPRHRAAGRRVARGPRGPLGGRPRRRPDRAGGLRRRHRRRAADDQAVRARELGRDDPGAHARRTGRGARPGLPLRRRRAGRGLRRRRPRPRGLDHRQRPRPARGVRPGRDRVRPRVLRLRREVHARPVRELDPRRGARGDPPGPAQDRPRRVPGDRRRGLRPGRLPARRRRRLPVRDQHDPGLHPDQPLSDDAGRGRLHLRRRLRPDRRPGGRTPRVASRPSGSRPRTCRDERTPARATVPDARPDAPDAIRPASLGRAVDRPGRRGAGDARLGGGDLRRRGVAGLRLHEDPARGRPVHRPGGGRGAPSPAARGENLFRLSTGPLLAALERLPTVDHARIDVRLPATLAVTIDEREPVLVWRAGDARYLAAADGTLFAKLGDDAAGRRCGRSARGRRQPGRFEHPRGRVAARPRSTSMRRPGWPRSGRPTSAARRSRWPSR